jgi:hypothetical protein
VAQPIFFETNTHVHHFYHRKIAKNLGYIYIYLKQLPKVNNRPIGDSSPNLVTLVGTLKLVVASQGQFFQKKIRFVKPQMSNVLVIERVKDRFAVVAFLYLPIRVTRLGDLSPIG